MTLRLPSLFGTTTFRLAMIHAGMFAGFAALLLAYLFASTAVDLERRFNQGLTAEINSLMAAYATGGLSRINQAVIERSSARGPYFYLLTTEDGGKISGDFDLLPVDVQGPYPRPVDFQYELASPDGAISTHRAEGQIVQLPDGSLLLIASGSGDRTIITSRIISAIWTGALAGLILSLLGGVIISRQAARRADALARTTEAVMGGDLSQRAPVEGSGDEFDRLGERLNAMLDRVERLIHASRHSGDAIAHDLRSPLTRMRNRLVTLMDDLGEEGDPALIDSLGATLEEVDGLLATFAAILRLSRLETGEATDFRRINLTEVLEEMAELYDPACESVGLSFEAEIAENVFILADKGLVAQAVSNLLDNALKYTESGGGVTLRLRRRKTGEGVEISVTDTGPGIPEGDRDRVLQRFVRLEASRTKPGDGLGLSLVNAVATLHRGALELSDGPGDKAQPGLRAALILPN
jgi:signal transduction histidine kinase